MDTPFLGPQAATAEHFDAGNGYKLAIRLASNAQFSTRDVDAWPTQAPLLTVSGDVQISSALSSRPEQIIAKR